MAKVDKNASKIAIILLHTVIEAFDVTLVEEAQHMLFELPAALAGDNLD